MARKTVAILCTAAFFLCVLGARTAAANDDPAYWIEYMRPRGNDAQARGEARKALIAMGAAAVPALIDATRDEVAVIRWEAVNALGSIGLADPTAALSGIAALVARALTDEDPHPQWRSLWALLAFPSSVVSEQIVPSLRQGLESEDERVCWKAAVGLAYLKQPESAALLNGGLDRRDLFECWEAIYCLSFVHDEESAALLVEVLTDTARDEILRQEAANTLGEIGDPVAIPALLVGLEDPAAGVRWRAALALSKMRVLEAISAIEAALERETHDFAIEQMQQAVERLREIPGEGGA